MVTPMKSIVTNYNNLKVSISKVLPDLEAPIYQYLINFYEVPGINNLKQKFLIFVRHMTVLTILTALYFPFTGKALLLSSITVPFPLPLLVSR